MGRSLLTQSLFISAFLLSFLNSHHLHASFPEFYGANVSTSAIGNQANLNPNEAGNNYYVPAFMAFSDKLSFSFNSSMVQHNFLDINSIVTKNSTNSSTNQTSNLTNNYKNTYILSLNLILPLELPGKGRLGLSVFTPVKNLMETNSGHPFLPEYVLYRARYKRTSAHFNYAQKLNDKFSFSLGSLIGFQVAARANAQTSLNGTGFGSNADANAIVTPSFGVITSLLYYPSESSMSYFTYQQGIKSNLDAQASGEITEPTAFLFDISIESMINYDPHIFRIGQGLTFSKMKIFGSVEYQIWESYKTPIIRIIKNNGSLIGSEDFEQIQVQNIFVPKLGASYSLTDSIEIMAGVLHRDTPLKGDFSGAGNSIDTPVTTFSAGSTYAMSIFGKTTKLGFSAQYHKLKELQVTKTATQENGNAGSKIGAPGYTIGGNIINVSLGLDLLF
jgi:hypothetical protein